jgi:hypothetical protein
MQTRPSLLTQRVHPRVHRWLAWLCFAASIPAFAFAVSACLRGGAHFLSGAISAALIGVIFLGAALCAFCGARSVRGPGGANETSNSDDGNAHLWSSLLTRGALAIGCLVISVLFVVPAAIVYAQWQLESGFFAVPASPPPLEHFGMSTFGMAFLSAAIGLLARQHRIAAGGLLLLLIAIVGYVAYEFLVHQW